MLVYRCISNYVNAESHDLDTHILGFRQAHFWPVNYLQRGYPIIAPTHIWHK